jgi:hypothetical protein
VRPALNNPRIGPGSPSVILKGWGGPFLQVGNIIPSKDDEDPIMGCLKALAKH